MRHLHLIFSLTTLSSVGCGYVGLETHSETENQRWLPLGGSANLGGEKSWDNGSGGLSASGGNDAAGGRQGAGGTDGAGGRSDTGGSDGAGGTVGTGGTDGAGGTPGENPVGILFDDRLDGPLLPGVENDTGGKLVFTESNSRNGLPVLKATQGLPDQVVITHEFSPFANDSLYFRGWLFVPEGAVTGSLKIVGLHDDGTGSIDVNLLPNRVLEIYQSPLQLEKRSGQESHPENEWFCLQIRYDLKELTAVTVSVNNQVTTVQNSEFISIDGQVSVLDYGLPFNGPAQTGGYVYWDDVALSTEPLGCH